MVSIPNRMNDPTFEELCEQFLAMESELGLLDERVAGVYFWERLRFKIHKRITSERGVSEAGSNDSSTLEEYLSGGRLLVRNVFRQNPFRSPQSDLLFYGKGRRKRLDDGLWWDIYIDPLIEALDDTPVCLERPYDVSHARPAKTDELRYTDLIQYTGTLLQELGVSEVSLSSAETALLERIEREIDDRFDVKVPLRRLVRADLSRRRVRLPLYRRLVRRIDPQIAFLTAAYNGRETFVEACQAEGVPAVELQHGVVTKYHMGYSFPNEDKHVFPEYFFSFGEYWSDAVDLPIPDENVFPVGYPYLEDRAAAFEDVGRKDRILVISQPHSGTRLSEFALAIAECESIESDVIYKLHPKEYDGLDSKYPRLKGSTVSVSAGEPPLYELLATSAVQVGVNSTALYEGLHFGLDTYILDEPEAQYMTYLLENDHAVLVCSPKDFIGNMTGGNQESASVDRTYFFTPDAHTNIQEAIGRIAKRVGKTRFYDRTRYSSPMEAQTTQPSETDALARELSENGVVSVEGYLHGAKCDEIRETVKELLANDELTIAGEDMTGSEMMSASETIVNQRSGKDDDGMLDIFNIDETIPEIRDIKKDDFVSDIIHGAGDGKYEPENINVYYNRSVTNTRGYHFDSYNSQFKAFVYLTDVPDESYGPYSYVKGSNRRSYPRRRVEGVINRFRDKKPTAAIFVDEEDIVTFTAPKGTLIISDQTGYHRGIPQSEGRERMLISNSHTPQ